MWAMGTRMQQIGHIHEGILMYLSLVFFKVSYARVASSDEGILIASIAPLPSAFLTGDSMISRIICSVLREQ